MPPDPRLPLDATRRSFWGHVVVACAVAVHLLVAVGYARFFTSPSAGFLIVGIQSATARADAFAVTPPAAEAAPPRPSGTRIVAVNGHRIAEIPPGAPPAATLRGWLHLGVGDTNRFVLDSAAGDREIIVPVARPSLGVWLRHPSTYTELVGLVYLLAGLLVWWQRHTDRAALPLLTFAALASVQMAVPGADLWLDDPVATITMPILPLYATAGFQLTLAFTGYHQHPHARVVSWGVMGLSAALALILLVLRVGVARGMPAWEPVFQQGLVVTGALLLVTLAAIVGVCWRATRPPHPLGLRRRAAFLGRAVLMAFSVPSAFLVVAPVSGPLVRGVMSVVMPLSMATFPVLLGYAIVRHRMFDLRIVLRQGVVYGALSLLVTLGYLGVVLSAVRVVGRHAEQPLFIALIAGALVLGASLLKLRVQHAVDRLVFRTRYVYADAVARASAELARARSIDAIVGTMRTALVEAMQLSRAYVALADGASAQHLRTYLLGSTPDPATGSLPPTLPRQLEASHFAPIERVLATGRAAMAHDSRAATAQATRSLAHALASGLLDPASRVQAEHHGEDTFWGGFCIEAIVPVRIGAGATRDRVVGLLLLGPRRDERPFDLEDERLLETLANQLAVALENARAFEEIERLKAGLEAEVEARTRELRVALDGLQRAQVTLLQSQKHALLGRLVAGIVHEANSPLGAVQSAADTIRRSVERALEHLQTCHPGEPGADRALRALASSAELTAVIESGAERLGALVSSLSAFVSLDQAEVRRVDVRDSLDSALTLLAPRLTEGIGLERQLGAAPLPVRCRPARLNQVFLNLLENAINAVAPRGRVVVAAAERGDSVVVTVRDDGPGIPPSVLERVFDFGFTTKASGRVGLGLGLPASLRAVEELGGTLSVEPGSDGGTVATVVLPLADDSPSTPVPPSRSDPGPPRSQPPAGGVLA